MDFRAVKIGVRVKNSKPQLLAMLFRSVFTLTPILLLLRAIFTLTPIFLTPIFPLTLTPILLALAACDGSGQSGKSAANASTHNAAEQSALKQNSSAAKPAARTVPPSVSYEQIPSAGKLAPPAATLTNPLNADPAAAQQGQMLFAAMNCDGCHGGGAVGFVGPSLVDGRWRYGGDDGELFHSIFYGRPRGMPAYGGILPDTTVWQLISYMRAQPVPGVVPTVAWP